MSRVEREEDASEGERRELSQSASVVKVESEVRLVRSRVGGWGVGEGERVAMVEWSGVREGNWRLTRTRAGGGRERYE